MTSILKLQITEVTFLCSCLCKTCNQISV